MKILKSVLFLLIICQMAYGQGEFSLYNLNRTVPQAHQLNPAFFSDAKVVVGLPVLSSTKLSMNTDQLSFSNVFTQNLEQSLTMDFDNISEKLNDKNNFSVNSDIQLFFFGLNVKDNYFSLSVNERVNSVMGYSKDIVDMAIYGNGDPRIFGRNIPLDDIFLNQNLYHEVALGYARNVNDKLSVGARVKFLFGVLNAETDNLSGYIRTDVDSIHITNSSFSFRNSGYSLFSEELDILSMAKNSLPFNNGNTGFGLDLGAQYQITDKIGVSASVTDLGYIDWKENTNSIGFNDVTYSFKGFDLIDLIDGEDSSGDFFQDQLDSLESLYSSTETEGIAYRSSLASNFYASFDYQLAEKHKIGANFYGRMANGDFQPEFGAYYNLLIGRVVNAVVNGAFRNGSVSSFGLGFSVNMGPVQLYAMTESATAFVNPEAAHLIDARFGINFTFGRKKKSKQEEIIELQEEELLVAEEAEAQLEEVVEEETAQVTEESIIPPAAVVAAVAIPIVEAVSESDDEFTELTVSNVEATEPIEMVVKKGQHEDELKVGHYVVVGAFLSRLNVQKYSNLLKEGGYDNQFGFLTEKAYYYVTVYKNNDDIEVAREIRNEFRSKDGFEFSNAWLLSVVE